MQNAMRIVILDEEAYLNRFRYKSRKNEDVMFSGEERREALIRILEEGTKPVSGTELARQLNVSRQVIVQDIALLRAVNKNILATNKGYVLFREKDQINKVKRTVCVCHEDRDILKEFECILDFGARILDCTVEHEIYGQISVELVIQSMEDAEKFVNQLGQCESKSLNILTGGIHYHTIEAASVRVLDAVERALDEAGYLVKVH